MSNTSSALVSVIIPAYNAAAFITETLNSVIRQTYGAWEIIVVEDASNDGTQKLVESIASANPNRVINYLRQQENQGVSATRNTGVRMAKGEYLAFLDADDQWAPEFLDRSLQALEQDKADLCYWQFREFYTDSGKTRSIGAPRNDQLRDFPLSLTRNPWIIPSAVFMRRNVYDRVGPFDETPAIQHTEDWDFWMRAVERQTKFLYIPEVGCHYRIHEGQANTRKIMMLRSSLFCLKKNRATGTVISRREYRKAIWQYTVSLFKEVTRNDWSAATVLLLQVAWLAPLRTIKWLSWSLANRIHLPGFYPRSYSDFAS